MKEIPLKAEVQSIGNDKSYGNFLLFGELINHLGDSLRRPSVEIG
ncbi:MAG TPA: hypothetical protein VFI27_13010 [candidate division Zixibacteria bacterium]|nr:hypothetical protein [candidate division Zixibacteria bacterium]